MSWFKEKRKKEEEQKEVYQYVRKEDEESLIPQEMLLDLTGYGQQQTYELNQNENSKYDLSRLDDRMDLKDMNDNGIDDRSENAYDCPICDDREF